MWTFIGVVLTSGVVGTIVGHVLTARQDERGLRRQKLEALHLHLTAFNLSLIQIHGPYRLAMLGELSLAQAQAVVTQEVAREADRRNLEHARMLTSLYFPGVQPALDPLLRLQERFMSALTKYQQGGFQPNPEAAAELDAVFKELEVVDEGLRTAMIREARTLENSWWYQLPRLRRPS